MEGTKLIVKGQLTRTIVQGHTALGSWSYLGPIILGVHVYSGQCLQLQTILLDSARPYWGPNNSAGVKQPDSWQVRGLKGSEDQELCQLSIFTLAGQRLPKRVLVRAREIREAGPKTWTHIRHPKLIWEGKETVITPVVWFSCVWSHPHSGGWDHSRQSIHHLSAFVLESQEGRQRSWTQFCHYLVFSPPAAHIEVNYTP